MSEEHQRQILENQSYWDAKPELRRIYRDFHQLLAENLSTVAGETVEIGSGIGNIREAIPTCVRTDLFENPWIDRRENIYRLSMVDGSVANLILFDVFHHLEFPMAALRECRRVLASGGRLLVFDHDMSLLGGGVSKFVHHERKGFAKPYSLAADFSESPSGPGYYADHANAHRILMRRFDELLAAEWRRVKEVRLPAFEWLLSGGYRGPSLYAIVPQTMLALAERVGQKFPSLFALRLIVILEPQ
jgi:SAM-dependent methyltransferase